MNAPTNSTHLRSVIEVLSDGGLVPSDDLDHAFADWLTGAEFPATPKWLVDRYEAAMPIHNSVVGGPGWVVTNYSYGDEIFALVINLHGVIYGELRFPVEEVDGERVMQPAYDAALVATLNAWGSL